MQKLISLPNGMAHSFLELERKTSGEWFCTSDPPHSPAGSGGGTAHILAEAYKSNGNGLGFEDWLVSDKKLVIHSGGQSRRLPAYSVTGKSLIPLPVFRWSSGQNLDQKLLDFQVAFYEKILKRATGTYCTLIGSGDVMFLSTDRFHHLPVADVLLFGIWVDDETASRHGVFFSPRDRSEELAFVRQKPSVNELRELAGKYYYLMDSGIVLLSAELTKKLMLKSGWDPASQSFISGVPGFYDLYSDMLTCFGTEARNKDPEIGEPDVKLVPLNEGEFYHFGSNRDLITSTLRLQNRVIDQRLRRSREQDHHPSIFQQNSDVKYRFTEENHDIWIENAHIPYGWTLSRHHILTGIPENDWEISLPEKICIDIIPVTGGKYCLRTYGFDDAFRGTIAGGVEWMSGTLSQWLEGKGLSPEACNLDIEKDIYDLPLFPILSLSGLKDMILCMLPGSKTDKRAVESWVRSERLSARDLSGQTDISSVYSQRQDFKKGILPKLARNYQKSIFYHLDLRKTAESFRESGIDLPPELPGYEPVIQRINDSMFRALALRDPEKSAAWEKRAFDILREEMIETLRATPVHPSRSLLDDQILWGRSPVRLDFAGGWTDTPPFCIINGGKVVNIAVELNGQPPLQVFARPLEEYKIVLRSIDLGVKEEIVSFEELENYATEKGAFSIPRAALVLAGFGRLFSQGRFSSLEKQLMDFGSGIELSLLAAIPKGSGLGTSSNLAATVLGTLNEFCSLNWDKYSISYRTLILEQMLTTGGGWQDQYGGVFPGLKMLETVPGIKQQPVIKWLPEQMFMNMETQEMMLLYYTGVTRVAKGILGEIVRSMFLNSSHHLDILHEMKIHAQESFDAILSNDFQGFAEKIRYSWELNQLLDPGTNPAEIQAILNKISDYLLSCKLLGAGGGGYLFILAKSADAAARIREILGKQPPNKRARFVDFRISGKGLEVTRS